MKVLEDIFQRCHKRHAERETLRQRKTVVTTALYKRFRYCIKVHCVRSNPLTLDALEKADISFMPIGHAPKNDQGPRDFGGDRFLKRQSAEDWRMKQWYTSWGIQIYTGIPSQRDGARWHDLEFKYDAICAAPETVSTCIEALLNTTANPLLTLTKSGGLRLSCRIQDYLHPNTDEAKFFIYKHAPTVENPNHRDIYLEIRGDEGYSRWDMRYEILLGNLLDPPIITKEVLFAPINNLRAALHEPESPQEKLPKNGPKTVAIVLPSLGSANLNLAKEAFLKRGFSYEREANGFHYWTHSDVYVSLWEDQDIVWVRATTPNTEFPTNAVPITDIWDDTGISVPTPVSEKVLAIREGNLSPLAIKRLPPKLQKQQTAPKVYKTLKEHSVQLQLMLNRDTRILALTATEANILTNTETEDYLLNNRATSLNIPDPYISEATEQRYRSKKLSSFFRRRYIFHQWEQVKDIPVDVRMTNPFQHGNVCEDPERFSAFEEKGGNASESICPQCPVWTACQERGYLSQPLALQRTNAQILSIWKLFLDPQYTYLLQQILGSTDEPEHICIIDERITTISYLFPEYRLSRKVVEEWVVNWRGNVLGNFAVALMNAIETQSNPYSNPVGPVRAVVEAFQQHENKIIQQMCYINVHGKVVERRTVDTKTGIELARYAIDFHGGATAYIPLDVNAEDRLRVMGLPTLPLHFQNVSRDNSRESEFPPTTDNTAVGAISESRPLPPNVGAISESRPLPPNVGAISESRPLPPNVGAISESRPLPPNVGAISESRPLPPNVGAISESRPLPPNVGVISESRPLPPNVGAISESRPLPPNEDICIPMQMAEAVALGILDLQTVEKIDFLPTVCRNPDWTYWHQLQRFFAHYPRNVDAPMQWDDKYLKFRMPPKLHPDVKRLMLISTYLSDQQLRRVFPDEEMDVIRVEPTAWVPGNKVFQIRSSSKSLSEILNYDFNSDVIELSKIGERYFLGIRAEIDRNPSIKHAIVTNSVITDKLADLTAKQNVCFVADYKALHEIEKDIEAVQVLWIVGRPFWPQDTISHQAQMLFGNDEKPLNYEGEMWTGHYKDERIQKVYDQNVAGLLTQIVGYLGLNRSSGKTVMLLTNSELPDITDRPETLLFDWEDFEIAGGLNRLEEAVRTRERFEAESANLTAESSREEVERVLGCSARQANRVLQKLRGGNIPRVTFREQILFLLASGREKTTSSLAAAIDSSPQAIGNQLKQLLDEGEIVRVRRGVYTLSEAKASELVGWIKRK